MLGLLLSVYEAVVFSHLLLSHSFQWVSLSLPVCGLEMLLVLGTQSKPSCPARSLLSLQVSPPQRKQCAAVSSYIAGENSDLQTKHLNILFSLSLFNLNHMLSHVLLLYIDYQCLTMCHVSYVQSSWFLMCHWGLSWCDEGCDWLHFHHGNVSTDFDTKPAFIGLCFLTSGTVANKQTIVQKAHIKSG